MTSHGGAPVGTSWAKDFTRDRQRLGVPTAVALARDSMMSEHDTRTTSRKVSLGIGMLKIGFGVGRLATGDVGAGLRLVSGGGRQVLEAAGALKGETEERRARLDMVRTLAEAAAARWPREIDLVLVGMRHQRELYFRQAPPANPSPSPVATGRQLAWQVHKGFRTQGAGTEAYREAREHLERLQASAPASTTLSAGPARARPTHDTSAATVLRAVMVSRPPSGRVTGLPAVARDARGHHVRGWSAGQAGREGRER